jgi:hypothetical protein
MLKPENVLMLSYYPPSSNFKLKPNLQLEAPKNSFYFAPFLPFKVQVGSGYQQVTA